MEYGNERDFFPERAGSHRDLTNPALEFVKTVLHVLSLDSSVDHQLQRMRRALLAQTGHREYSGEAQYSELGLSFILTDVICSYCNRWSHFAFLCLCLVPDV